MYRFRKCDEHSFEALLNDEIYFTTASHFNDPYDCLIYLNKNVLDNFKKSVGEYDLKDQLKKIRESSYIDVDTFGLNSREANKIYYDKVKGLSDSDFNKLLTVVDRIDTKKNSKAALDIIKNIQEFIEKYYREHIYIACFSERVDSILMWSHYADYHKGFAIGYTGSDLFSLQPCAGCQDKCKNEYSLSLYPVLYGNNRLDATQLVMERVGHYIHSSQLNKDLQFISPDKLFSVKLETFKEKSWKYEKEWRFICTCSNIESYKRSTSCLPNSIYLGSKISKINKKIIMDLVKDKDVSIFEMYASTDSQKYELNCRKIKG